MNATTPHPAHEHLARFGHGLLSAEERQSVEAHVATCDECTAQLTTLDADSLAVLLRRGPELAPCPASTPMPSTSGSLTALFSATRTAGDDGQGDIPEPLRDHPRYRVLRLIGRGGMGNVYLAHHRHMDREVALKVIDPSLLSNPEAVRRFRQEVRAAARLSHPNIVQAYDSDEAGGAHFLVLEYVPGQHLAGHMAKARLPYREACEYARQAAVALQYAHDAGLVHRDVKPHNLMLTPDGQVKVLDFGLARLVARPGAANGATETGSLMGTPDYVAPEQARDAATADGRADLYSLGCTLYHLLTGLPPFPGGSPVEKIARHLTEAVPALDAGRLGLPAGLAEVVARMTSRKPEDRYQTAGEAAAALASFTSPQTMPHRRRSTPWAWVAALVGMVGFVALAGAVVYRIQTDKGELVIETIDDDVEVFVSKGGKLVKIYDPKSKQRLILDSGTYELELKGKPTGLKLDLEKATLKRGGVVIAKITHKNKGGDKPQATAEPAIIHPLHRISWPKGTFDSLDLSSESRHVVVNKIGSDGRTRERGQVLQLETGKVVLDLPGAGITRFTPDGKQVLSVGGRATFTLQDVATGEVVRQFGSGKRLSGMVLSLTGSRVVTTIPEQSSFVVSDWATGKVLCQIPTENLGYRMTPDGRHLLVQKKPGTPLLAFDAETGKSVDAFSRLRDVPDMLSLSASGRSMLSSEGGKLAVYDVATGKKSSPFEAGSDYHCPMWYGQRWLATSDSRFELRVWDVTARRVVARLRFPESLNDLNGVLFGISVDGQWAVVAGPTESIYVFRLPAPEKQ